MVGWEHISVSADRVFLPEGFSLTHNGLAQGYITDRVADLLRTTGWRDVLVNLGEFRALDGRAWPVSSAVQRGPIILDAKAMATSSGASTRFGADGLWNHLLAPRNIRSASVSRTVSVVTQSAALADGLSTALAMAAPEEAGAIAARFPNARVYSATG